MVRRLRRQVSVVGEDFGIQVSAVGMERRGNRAFCHCRGCQDNEIAAASRGWPRNDMM